jgi:cytochrome b6
MRIAALLRWLDDRLGYKDALALAEKKEIPQHRATIWYYLGAGILMMFGIQVATGLLLMLYYQPSLEQGYESVAFITNEVPLGWLIRSIHHWGANFMVGLVALHLVTTMLLKAYRPPREFTWMTGMMLLGMSMAFGFTGYLLPWDEVSLAATKIGTDIPRSIPVVGDWASYIMRGGEDVTGATITRFFAVHVCYLPFGIFGLLGLHLLLVQRHGMSLPVSIELRGEKPPVLPFFPNFVYRETIFWLLLFGALITVAVFFPAGLHTKADLMAPASEGIKPEWYFLAMFQFLKLFPSQVLGLPGQMIAILLTNLVGAALFFLPFIDRNPTGTSGRIITGLSYFFLVVVVALSLWGHFS